MTFRLPSRRRSSVRPTSSRLTSSRVAATRRWLARRARRVARARRLAAAATDDRLPAWPDNVHDTVRHFANPGPAFEPPLGVATGGSGKASSGGVARARVIAFYLPQFHAFPENDRWWGEGFTEWRNVARAVPRFEGHYQPRIPRDLGHYDLNRPETLHAQAALARAAGIAAFCFYYYWFDGKRLMDGPLDRFLDEAVDQDFCLMWANENWTRRWDGRESDVLVEQRYRPEDEAAFIADTARYLAHPRHVRVQGRPLFIVYRASELPEPRATIARWRARWTEVLGVAPWLLMAQSYDDRDPRPYGLDGAVEFPPHKVSRGVPDRSGSHELFDPAFEGHVRAYADVVERAEREPSPDWPIVRTVAPHWDNDARREGRGVTLHGSTPARYERWLERTVTRARAEPFRDEPLVFVNAWNEWAEGAYLEPDVYYGHACLNATRRVLFGANRTPRARRLLLVGHDAHANGAQMLLLALAEAYVRELGFDVQILLLGDGALLPRFRELATTHVLRDVGSRAGGRHLETFLEREAFPMAICNTTVAGSAVPAVRASGTRVLSLVHELPTLVRDRALEPEVHAIAGFADAVVFPADLVRDGFLALARPTGKIVVRPQGLHRPFRVAEGGRKAKRAELGIDDATPLVINVGYADRRKGFDLFVLAAAAAFDAGLDARFVWIGGRSDEMSAWLAGPGKAFATDARLRFEPFDAVVEPWFVAADCLLLTSREDPYPSVALEAMSVGLPVVSFAGATGLDALQQAHGVLAADTEPSSVVAAVRRALDDNSDEACDARIAYIECHGRYLDYARALIGVLDPASVPST